MDHLTLILMALFAMICASFGYTNRAVDKIWKYLTNHLTQKVKDLVEEECNKRM